jgi:hypothetical protein
MQTYWNILNVYLLYYLLIVLKSYCEFPEEEATNLIAHRCGTTVKFKHKQVKYSV